MRKQFLKCIEGKDKWLFQVPHYIESALYFCYFTLTLLFTAWIGINIGVWSAVIRGKPCSHIHLHPGNASLGQGPQPNLSRSIQWELVYYFYVRNYEDRAVTTTPAQITKIYLVVNNIDCTFV